MDHVHTRAVEALQPFIHLANSNSATSPRYVANLITNATSSPQTYVFAELLETPMVQALRSNDTPAEFRGYLQLLEIFAWGTWQEYQATPNLPPLNDSQTLKLRLLSLLTLATTINPPLTYTTLMTALSIPTTTELESLITKAIYASLITARLSPTTTPALVNVTSVAPLRDVKPQSLTSMISILTEWESRCGKVIDEIEVEIANITARGKGRYHDAQKRGSMLEKALVGHRGLEKGSSNVRGRGGGGGGLAPKKGTVTFGSKKHGTSTSTTTTTTTATGTGSNKREFSADDDDAFDDSQDIDDGYWENDQDGGAAETSGGSRMDIDEGAGSGSSSQPNASHRGAGSGTASNVARHAKRLLGKKT